MRQKIILYKIPPQKRAAKQYGFAARISLEHFQEFFFCQDRDAQFPGFAFF